MRKILNDEDLVLKEKTSREFMLQKIKINSEN